jgi:hypothetical protein
MKKMKCLDCEDTFEAESEDEMMQKMHPHYMEKHKDIMEAGTEEKKEVWMKKFHEEWEKAEAID